MSDYQLAVQEAQQAVAHMEDGKLKDLAFAQVLEYLLSSGEYKTSRMKRPERDGAVVEKSGSGVGPNSAAWLFI